MYLVAMRHGLRATLFSLVLIGIAAPATAMDVAPVPGNNATKDTPKGTAKTAPKAKNTAPLPAPDRVEISVPYPNAGMYLYRGIYGSFAGGRSREADTSAAKEWQGPLFQWQGEVGYFYTPWFSAGVGFRINAGSPSDSNLTVENRYFLTTRAHKAWPRIAGYVGMRFGVDDVNFSLRSEDTLDLGEPFRETNAAMGLEAGLGWKFSRYAGFTLGQRMDVSLVRQSADNPHRALNFMTQPGIAVDMVRVNPALGDHVKALYLLTEFQFGQSLPERGDWTRQFAWITGLSLAF
jgi:hypothetical protein